MAKLAIEPETAHDAEGPPKLLALAHISLPCRELEEGKRFYIDVLGGELLVSQPTFASFLVAGVEVGIGAIPGRCSWVAPSAEYPHIAFYADPEEMRRMKRWLNRCGIPSSDFWTRFGIEALMLFRDPSGNMIELFCKSGFDGVTHLPRAHSAPDTLIDVASLIYSEWRIPPVRSTFNG
jgi:catechol 2,3-dioxygenase-like lactoylglutathione lyase family enzyme